MPSRRFLSPEVTLHLSDWVRRRALPLTGRLDDFDDVMDLVGDRSIVMIGEASHGTADFYSTRARLTQRLIAEKGFNLVAIEGDWPDALGVNRFVKGGPGTARDSLRGFRRYPTWMWRNTTVLAFIEWLRAFNDGMGLQRPKVGFYGLDVYSLHASMEAVLRFLRRVDPRAADVARQRFACFEPFGEDTQRYALQAHYLSQSCEDEVVQTLVDLQQRRWRYVSETSSEAVFEAEMNALAVMDAERYYRAMLASDASSWNLRDRHMTTVLERLLAHFGPTTKAVLWEHNTHIGDFRATGEAQDGYLNIGQLVREQYGEQAVAVGFGTHRGTVTCSSEWDGVAEFKRVPPARPGSYEDVFHQSGVPNFYMRLKGLEPRDMPDGWLFQPQDERAIGVVYFPEREDYGNYLSSRLANRYDAYFFFDESLAVEPLDPGPEPPGLETYPMGL
ncbi:MAG TPA: erythromycin esterase family protein [Stenomitos sp.]